MTIDPIIYQLNLVANCILQIVTKLILPISVIITVILSFVHISQVARMLFSQQVAGWHTEEYVKEWTFMEGLNCVEVSGRPGRELILHLEGIIVEIIHVTCPDSPYRTWKLFVVAVNGDQEEGILQNCFG